MAQGVSLAWAKSWGDNQEQEVMATAVDSNGNVFVASRFQGTVDFDPGPGVVSFGAGSLYDIAVSKFDANGTFLWAKEIGGNGNDYPLDIAIGDSGSVYITGTYGALMDFDPGPGTLNRFPVGNIDVFLIKLDNNGIFKWGISFGGSFQDYGYGLAVDEDNSVYVCGEFRSSVDFDPGSGFANRLALSSANAFVSKYDLNGNYQDVANLGSGGTERGRDVAIDADKNVIVTGFFSNGPSDFDPGSGIANLFANSDDVFVCKLDSNLNYEWAKDFGGNFNDEAYHLEVDDHGNIYTTGIFGNTVDFDPGSGQSFVVAEGEEDIFLHRFKPNGDFDFVKTFGSDSVEFSYGMTRSNEGDIYLTGGFTDSLDMDPDTSAQSFLVPNASSVDVFFAKFDSLGTYEFANSIGGSGEDYGRSISLVLGDIVLGGAFSSSNMDFDPGSGVSSLSSAGGTDAFISRNGDCGQYLSSIDTTVCGSFVWGQTGLSYTSSGTYYDTVAITGPCDSIYALVLTVIQADTSRDTVSACDSYLWVADSVTYTSSGQYIDTLENIFGCDSLVYLDLSILNSTSDTDTVVACDIYQWSANNQSYTSSGFYQDTITNQAGCDSLVFLDLSINLSTSGSDSIIRCDSYLWPTNNQTYTNSGIYIDTLTNSQSCDSIVSLVLTINNSNSSFDTVVSCDQYFWIANNQTYIQSGVYIDTLNNQFGCDSIARLNLTINNSNSGSDTVVSCDAYQWPANNQTYTMSGIYVDTLLNQQACDSVVSLYLTINNSNSGSDTVTACDSYTWPTNNQSYSNSGIYFDTLTNSLQCDSVVSLVLTINRSSSGADTVIACDSYTWPVNNQSYTSSGIYEDTLMNAQQCDSVITLYLTINQSSFKSDTVETCDEYLWPVNNQTYSQSGIYRDTLSNALACDSVLTLHLEVIEIDTNIQQFTDSAGTIFLATQQDDAMYQWLRCLPNNSYDILIGETDSILEIDSVGSYAVAIDYRACTEYSICYEVNQLTSVEERDTDPFKLFPNPSRDKLFITQRSLNSSETVRWKLFNALGKLIDEGKFDSPSFQLQLPDAKGIYIIELGIEGKQNQYRKRILKQ